MVNISLQRSSIQVVSLQSLQHCYAHIALRNNLFYMKKNY